MIEQTHSMITVFPGSSFSNGSVWYCRRPARDFGIVMLRCLFNILVADGQGLCDKYRGKVVPSDQFAPFIILTVTSLHIRIKESDGTQKLNSLKLTQ
jgi:hypothetical protein